MRNLYNPTRWYAVINGAGEKEQQDILHPYGVPFSTHPNGEWVLWTDYLHLLESYKVVQKREGELSIQATVDEIAISQMKDEIKKLNEESTRSRNNQSDNLGVAEADASSGSKTEEANQGCIWNKNQMSRQYYEANPNWYVRKDIHDEVVAENARLKAEVERLTKAGDALAGKAIRLEYNDYWSEYEKVEDVCIDEVEAWNAAKGVQS